MDTRLTLDGPKKGEERGDKETLEFDKIIYENEDYKSVCMRVYMLVCMHECGLPLCVCVC